MCLLVVELIVFLVCVLCLVFSFVLFFLGKKMMVCVCVCVGGGVCVCV